jgi:hypothetical protein
VARPETGAIDRALLEVLQADAELAALMPGGVWFGLAAKNLTQFVLITLQDGTDDGVFEHRGLESLVYAVQAIGLSRDVSLATMRDAAARIDALLDDTAAPLATPVDYASIDCAREKPLATSVVDEVNKELHWHHFGAFYRVTAAWPDVVS